jgi:Domain of unknown function (DUF1957)
VRLDDALERHEPAALEAVARARGGGVRPAAGMGGANRGEAAGGDVADWSAGRQAGEWEADWAVSTWGAGGDLSTWSGPAVAEIAFATRAAELEVVRAGHRAGAAAVRELLALQSSDWAFMVSRGLAVPYAHERFEAHRQGVERALAAGPGADPVALRNLAVHAEYATLLAG